jgi:hypothetical protein
MAKKKVVVDGPLARIMTPKYLVGLIAALVILAIVINLRQFADVIFPPPDSTASTTTTVTSIDTTPTTTTTIAPAKDYTIALSLENGGNKIHGGAEVHNLVFTIDSIEVHSTETDEWTDIPIDDSFKSPDIMEYPPRATFGQKDVVASEYDKLRVRLQGGTISITNQLFYIFNPKEYELIAADETEIDYSFTLASDETKTLVLTLDSANSITRLGTSYKMEPIFSIELIDGLVEDM